MRSQVFLKKIFDVSFKINKKPSIIYDFFRNLGGFYKTDKLQAKKKPQ